MKQIFGIPAVTLVAALLVTLPFVGTAQEKAKDKDKNREKQYRLTLNIEGVECANCSRVMAGTLKETDLEVAGQIKPDTTGPSRVIATCRSECDLGEAAAQVNQAQTPHRAKVEPSLTLILFADLDEKSASAALATCRKLKGVDGPACQADIDTGEIQIKINGQEKLTAGEILTAMRDTGIEAKTTSPKARPTKKQKSKTDS